VKLKPYLLASAIGVLPFAASAADLPVKAPIKVVQPVPFTWTGFYVGGTVGLIDQGTTGTDIGGLIVSDGTKYGIDGMGAIFGAHAGFNYQMGMWVLGVEADYSGTTLDTTLSVPPLPSTVSSKLDSLGTVRGRVGYVFQDVLLVYATGGWAYGHVKNRASWEQDPTFTVSETLTKYGWTAGGGVDWAFTNHWIARAEVLYVDLGSSTTGFSPSIAEGSGCRFGFRNTYTIGRLGLSYKF
jgi:outer membrane immunogenic protein